MHLQCNSAAVTEFTAGVCLLLAAARPLSKSTSVSQLTVKAMNAPPVDPAQQDPRFQTFVAAFVPLQKLLNNNAISESSYKAICAILEKELDNCPLQSEQDVISAIQTRAQAQVPPTPPPNLAQDQFNSFETKPRGMSDDDGTGTLSRG